MLPDLNRLKVFYYIYSLKSIVAAAKALHLTQPAVSIHLKKLESELKMQLFVRLHKKIIPTSAGERLFHIVGPFIEELQDGVDTIRLPSDKPSGMVRIGVVQEFGKEYFPRICHSFRKKYPDVTFHLRFGETAYLLSQLSQGELDFTLIDYFSSKEQLLENHSVYDIEPLIEEEFILACSHDYYEKAVKQDHSFENLVTKDFLTDEPDAGILKFWFKYHFGKSDIQPNLVMNIDSHQAMISCIKLGMGMGIAVSHLVWEEISRGILIPIRTGKKEIINKISLIQLQDKIPTLTEKTFQRYLKKEISHTSILKRFSKISNV